MLAHIVFQVFTKCILCGVKKTTWFGFKMWHKTILLHMILRNLMYLTCWDMWQWAFFKWKQADCTRCECNFLRRFMREFKCEKIFFSEIYVRHKCSVGCYVCTCTNLLELNTVVKYRMYLNSVAMGQINQCWFQSYVVLINNVFLWKNSSFSWVVWKNIVMTIIVY